MIIRSVFVLSFSEKLTSLSLQLATLQSPRVSCCARVRQLCYLPTCVRPIYQLLHTMWAVSNRVTPCVRAAFGVSLLIRFCCRHSGNRIGAGLSDGRKLKPLFVVVIVVLLLFSRFVLALSPFKRLCVQLPLEQRLSIRRARDQILLGAGPSTRAACVLC